jgi:hypothetical protein
MKKSNLLRFAVAAAMGFSIAACDLAIDNPTQGDTKRVLGTPDDAEALISTYWKRWMSGVYGSTGDIEGMANVMSLMNYSSLANNCQNNHLPFAGSSNTNSPGNVCGGEQARLYQYMNEVARVSSTFITQVDSGLNMGKTLPSVTDARNLRDKSWAEFLRALSLSYVAMIHDSSSIPSPNNTQTEPECNREPLSGKCTGQLHGYLEVMDSAYAAFDRAITYATTTPNPNGEGGFPIPDDWMPGTFSGWSSANFVKLMRSYRARVRANVARRSTDPVDWAQVVADAQNGLGVDYYVVTNTNSGPGNSWRQQYNSYDTWHQMPPFIIGMADTSGAYEKWISDPLSARGAGNVGFFMITPDLRFPQGKDRAAQQADVLIGSSGANNCGASSGGQGCRRYFYVRPPGEDVFSGQGWGWSNYGFIRFRSWAQRGDGGSARNGKTLFMTQSEIDLLQAEGLYKLGGNDVTVAQLINKTRTRGMDTLQGFTCPTGGCARGGGLPAVLPLRTAAATTVAGQPRGCVPKVPTGETGPVVCGDLWEALKYEKRIETAYTHFAPWYLDSRRWDDLPKDTPLWWPVPFQELQARGRPVSALYGTGLGSGNAPNSAAPGSAYGW